VDTIGEKLRSTREARKLSLKDVAKDTNISVLYIEALENEEFDRFPGETYVTGFMRSYAEYLKLDADEIIQHYKAFKIGESATPLEELTRPTRTPVFSNLMTMYRQYKNMAFFVGAALGIMLIIWMFVSLFSSSIDTGGGDSITSIQDEYNKSKQNIGIENIRNLQLANDSGFTLLYGNEAVQFMVDNKEALLLLKEIRKDSVQVELLPGEKTETLEMEKPLTLKLPEFAREVVFTLKGLTENRAKIQIALGRKPEAEEKDIAVEKGADVNVDNTRVVAQNEKNLKIVFEAEFIQKSYLELYLDGA